MTMASLSGRRLAEMAELGRWLLAIELMVAARAVDLREGSRLGAGTAVAYGLVRDRIPAMSGEVSVPPDLEPLADLARSGALGRI